MALDHHQALSKAKIQLMSRPDSAFFTTLCFSMQFVWDSSIPTAATDGRSIFINPEAYMALTPGQRVSRLLHETLHPALLHLIRKGGRDHKKWNSACDFCINGLLIDRGFERIETWLYDPCYQGMSADQIYALLPNHQEMPEDQLDILEPSPDDVDALVNHTQDILVRAAIQSKMANDTPGTIPSDIQIYLNGLLKPKLPWNRLLQKFLQKFDKSDYSFRKPNRRFFPTYHLPSLYGEKLIDMVIAVDTSGSVSDSDFHNFVSEIANILRMMRPEKIRVIQFDTEIKSVDEVKSIKELMAIKFTGRGGTFINPVLDWANVNKPQLLIVFSDGGFRFRFYDTQTKSTILWLIHNNQNFTPPFGQVIHYTI